MAYSVPGMFWKLILPPSVTISTRAAWSVVTRPSSPEKWVVLTEYSRTPPSSCAEEMRKMLGQSGHGLLSGSRSSGGRGRISNCVTERAPWRWAVPRQSAPVSPPPMMTTFLSFAVMKSRSGTVSPWERRFWSVR